MAKPTPQSTCFVFETHSFIAGNLSSCLPQWRHVLQHYPKKDEILSFISDGVDVSEFFAPFDGLFQGKRYCFDTPPKMIFPNSSSCGAFSDFISHTIMERVSNGSLRIVGRVGA
ncbi:hypothetical protein QZH41_005746 [Actinostola sp. cb2023]|nr:hypothetical protein QZH41_005746 [Actinostola sp. cb2023]